MIYLQLFWAFFKIGALGFGGGLAIISMIYDNIQQFVPITASQYADIVAIAQVTPGPIAVNTATYVGYETAGILGSFFATLGVATPAFLIAAVVVNMMRRYRESTMISGMLAGIRPATVGMIAAAIITVGRPAILPDDPLGKNLGLALTGILHGIDPLSIVICAMTVILIRKFRIGTFKVLILMAIAGALLGA